MLLLVWNLLIVLILPLKWYELTKYDSLTYKALGHTGFAAFGEYFYAFTLFYIACMLYYCYSLMKNIFINLYVCDIFLIFLFTWFPNFRGWPIFQFGLEESIPFYGIGYYLAIGILLMNLIGVIFYHRLTVGLRKVEEKKEK
jgi:hypothetical protein